MDDQPNSDSKKKDSENKPSAIKIGLQDQTHAATRMQEKLEKSLKAQAELAQKKTEEKIEEKANLEKSIPVETKKVPEINLTGDLAKVAEALLQKMLPENSLVDAFLIKVKLEKRKEPHSLAEILWQEKMVSKEQYQHIQKIETLTLKQSIPPKQIDFVLAKKLVEEKIIAREDLDPIIKIQMDLRKLGVYRSLDSLVTYSKLLPKEVVQPLLEQIIKPATPSAKTPPAGSTPEIVEKKRLLVTPPPKRLPVVLIFLLVFLLFGSSVFGLLFWKTFYSSQEEKKAELPKKIVMPIEKKEASPIQKAIEAKALPQEVSPEEMAERLEKEKEIFQKRMEDQGMVLWGKYWISKQQQEFLSREGWKENHKIPLVVKKEMFKAQWAERDSFTIKIIGKLEKTPSLAPGFFLKLEAQMFHAFQKLPISNTKVVNLNEQHELVEFKENQIHTGVCIATFEKPLPANLYFVRISIFPRQQTEFVQEILQIQPQTLWIPFVTHSFSKIQKNCQENQIFLEKTLQEMNQVLQKIKTKEAALWKKNSSEWLQEILSIQAKIAKNFESRSAYIFPESEKRILALLSSLLEIYKQRENAQNQSSEEILGMEQKILYWETEFFSFSAALKKEAEELFALFQQ